MSEELREEFSVEEFGVEEFGVEEFGVEESSVEEEELSKEEKELIKTELYIEENIQLEYIEYIEMKQDEQVDVKNYNIPKNIFLTHKSTDYINSKPELRRSIHSWLKYKKDYRIFYYDNAMCDLFIKKNFSEDVYRAYQRLPLAVMKADLWRYCVIYMYGGIYTDADAECMVHPDIFTSPKTLLVCGPEVDGIHLCQWCFAAPKYSPIIKSIIDLSVERILGIPKMKGEHIIHYLTGPGCFTDGIEKYLTENNKKTFTNKLQYNRYRSNVMCVFDVTMFNKVIQHHFAGSNADGWKQERDRKLM